MSQTEEIARRYFRAWTSRDLETVQSLLAPEFEFPAGGSFPSDATTTMVAEAYQDDIGFQMYDAARGDVTVRIVEQLTIRDGKIASTVFVTDPAAFARL